VHVLPVGSKCPRERLQQSNRFVQQMKTSPILHSNFWTVIKNPFVTPSKNVATDINQGLFFIPDQSYMHTGAYFTGRTQLVDKYLGS